MRTLFIITLICLCFVAKAQQNNTLFLMHDLPQANYLNPALCNECKLFIGIPIIGSNHINAFSTGFTLDDLYVNENGNIKFDPGPAINNFSTLELVESEMHLSLISIGYTYKNNYFTFNINEKFNSYSTINKYLALFLTGGNSQFEGVHINGSNTEVNAIHYREYALGWGRQLNKKLSLGIRAKLLFGKGNLYTQSSSSTIYTNENTFESTLTADATFYTSFPLDIELTDSGRLLNMNIQDNVNGIEYAFNRSNIGIAADFGIIYKSDNKVTLSASILDIGTINWKSNSKRYESSGTFEMTAETYENELQNINEVIDSVNNYFSPYVYNDTYKTPLVPSSYIGVNKKINEKYNIGATLHNEYFPHKIHTSFTLSGNTYITRNINAALSYSIQNKQINNIGLGIGATFGIFQFHAISDNIPAFFIIDNSKNINLRFGVALLFCKNREKREKPTKIPGALPCYTDPYNYKRHRR